MEIRDAQEMALELVKTFESICRESNIWYTLAVGSVLGAIRHGGFIPWDPDIDVYVKISDVNKLRGALAEGMPEGMKLYIWDQEPKYPLCFDRLSMVNTSHYDVHLDIFPLVGVPEKEKARKRFTRICFCTSKFFKCKYVDTQYSNPSHVKKIKLIRIFAKLIPDFLIRKWYRHLEYKYEFEKSDYVCTIASEYGFKECLPKKLLLDTKQAPFEDTMLWIPVKYDEYLTNVYGDYMTPKREGYKLLK